MKVKELIKQKGYTQKDFAAKLGMSPVGLSQLLNGKPSYPTLEKFADALDVPIWRLFVSPEEVAMDNNDGFASFVRYKGIHYTADSPQEFFRQVDELHAMMGQDE